MITKRQVAIRRQPNPQRRINTHNHRPAYQEPQILPPFTDEQAVEFNNKNAVVLEKELKAFNPTGKDNYIASIYLIGTKVQYANFPRTPNIMLLEKWANSLKENGLNGIIFHNCFADTSKFPWITWIRVTMPPNYMSGLYRYFIYDQFLKTFPKFIDNIFFTDSTDLDFLKNPFIQDNYKKDKIYVGCEQVVRGNKWMLSSALGYPKYAELAKEDSEFADSTLLNAGFVGGNLKTIAPFIEMMAFECSKMYPCAGTQDMNILNYLAYTEFKEYVEFGPHINTIFTAYEKNNNFAWIRHK